MSALDGRVALVTGAGRGLGRAAATRLAADGAQVVLTGRTRADLERVGDEIRSAGGRAIALPADVTHPDAVAALAERAQDEFGAVDILCANSGIAGPTSALVDVSYDEWLDTFAVNVHGVFLCARAVLPRMTERGSGSIVVIGSVTGKRPLPRRTAYSASKTALIGLVRSLAAEVGPHGVRVNLVSPGPVAGERLDAVLAAQADASGEDVDAVRDRWLADLPLGRFVEATDVAGTVAFLAGDAAGAITGQDVNVSAGAVMY